MIKLVLEQPVTAPGTSYLAISKVRAISRRHGFSVTRLEHIELTLMEMLTNQKKHAKGGGMVQIWETEFPACAIDLFSLDYGVGIKDVATASKDDFTTAGTMGRGLGAIKRLSSESEIFSLTKEKNPDAIWNGVAVWARFYIDQEKDYSSNYQMGAYIRAFHDGPYNGDYINARFYGNTVRWIHMDGLGHGQEASMAVEDAERFLNKYSSIRDVMDSVSSNLEGGRGAVAVIGEIDFSTDSVNLCGVGDMKSFLIKNETRQNVVFAPGILGHEHRSFDVHNIELDGGVVLTASDGIKGSWSLKSLPGLWRLHPQMISFMLGNVAGKLTDDQSMFVIKTKKGDCNNG